MNISNPTTTQKKNINQNSSEEDFVMTDEIRSVMEKLNIKKLTKRTKEGLAQLQLIKSLGDKVICVDRGSKKPMEQLTETAFITNEKELKDVCKLMNRKTANERKEYLCNALLVYCDNEYTQYGQEILMELITNFGKYPKDWKMGLSGSRWRDLKLHDGVCVRLSYYGETCKGGKQIQQHTQNKIKHGIRVCSVNW